MEFSGDLKWLVEMTFNIGALLVATLAFCAALSAAVDARKAANEAWRSNELSQLHFRLTALDRMECILNNSTHSLLYEVEYDKLTDQRNEIMSYRNEAAKIAPDRRLFPSDRGWITDMIFAIRKHHTTLLSVVNCRSRHEDADKHESMLNEEAKILDEYAEKVRDLRARVEATQKL